MDHADQSRNALGRQDAGGDGGTCPSPDQAWSVSLSVHSFPAPQASSIVHRTWTGNSFHTRSRGEAKDSALLLSCDAYLLEPTEWSKGSQASSSVWSTPGP